jgi:hypothetical protein
MDIDGARRMTLTHLRNKLENYCQCLLGLSESERDYVTRFAASCAEHSFSRRILLGQKAEWEASILRSEVSHCFVRSL